MSQLRPVNGVDGSNMLASPFLVEEAPEPVAELPRPPGFDCLLAQVYVPLTTELSLSFWNSSHEKVELEVCALRPPRTSLRAGNVALDPY